MRTLALLIAVMSVLSGAAHATEHPFTLFGVDRSAPPTVEPALGPPTTPSPESPGTAWNDRPALESAALPQSAQTRNWPAAIGENFGTPTFHDLTGDGVMEVIATDRQRTYVWDANGSLLPGWPQNSGEVDNCPAVADLDEDGSPEIIVATSGGVPKIRVYNVDGTQQMGFPVTLPWAHWYNSTSPAVADVDGDGHLDVGAQSELGVSFFDRTGHALPGWPYVWATSQNIAWSAPAVADLDRDGHMEVVVGTNCLYACSVHVIRFNGTAMPGWPRSTENIFSSPAVGDLDGDGDLEVVIQEGDYTWYGNFMHVWHHDGTPVAGWPREIAPQWESSRSNPAIADVDGDGVPEIVTATSDDKLHIVRIDGTEFPGYPRSLPADAPISSVQVIDVDGDGVEEFFLCYYAGGNQYVGGWNLAGTALPSFPKLLFQTSQLNAHGSAHLADIDGDGDLDLCAQGGTFGSGLVWVYELSGSVFHPGANRADSPKIRRDSCNSGFYPPRDPAGIANLGWTGGNLACFPNPLRSGQPVSLRLPCGSRPIPSEAIAGTGILSLFDPAGRRIGSVLADSRATDGLMVTGTLEGLFGVAPRPGVYFLTWARSAPASEQRSCRIVLSR